MGSLYDAISCFRQFRVREYTIYMHRIESDSRAEDINSLRFTCDSHLNPLFIRKLRKRVLLFHLFAVAVTLFWVVSKHLASVTLALITTKHKIYSCQLNFLFRLFCSKEVKKTYNKCTVGGGRCKNLKQNKLEQNFAT